MNSSHILSALDPVGIVRITARCMNALYRLQVARGNTIAQLADLAQANHEMVHTRDEFIVDLHAQLDQVEGQIGTLQTIVGEHEAMIGFLEEQVGALTLELNNAHEQLHFQQAQQDVPPDVMDMDGEDELEEIQGVSDLDFEVAAPSPAQLGAHSPVASEASVNNLDDF